VSITPDEVAALKQAAEHNDHFNQWLNDPTGSPDATWSNVYVAADGARFEYRKTRAEWQAMFASIEPGGVLVTEVLGATAVPSLGETSNQADQEES